jgi:hypothetical protein
MPARAVQGPADAVTGGGGRWGRVAELRHGADLVVAETPNVGTDVPAGEGAAISDAPG